MRSAALLKRSLIYYWCTNLAVIIGVGTAVSVLAGALLVGDSVRVSLRDLFLRRVGNTEFIVAAENFFREQLAEEIQSDPSFAASGFAVTCPLITLEGTVTHEASGRRGSSVQVYGVDERFWMFHGGEKEAAAAQAPRASETLLSPSLADELKAEAGDVVLLRAEKPSAIPVESLHGRKDDVGRTLRLTARGSLPASAFGEFSVRPQQTAVRAVFVPLKLLQKVLEQDGQSNTILISIDRSRAAKGSPTTQRLQELLKKHFRLEDMGLKLRALTGQKGIAVESESALVGDAVAEAAGAAAEKLNMRRVPILSYLANSIRSGGREIPYSLVTSLDDESFKDLQAASSIDEDRNLIDDAAPNGKRTVVAANQPSPNAESSPPLSHIILNRWAVGELGAKIGDTVALDYYLWAEDGRLLTRTEQFQLAGTVDIKGVAADRDLVPEYPGLTEAASLSDWDPPFPVDLSRIRARDEEYWDKYRTTPKAFIPLVKGQELWRSRFGKLTSLRVTGSEVSPRTDALEAYRSALRSSLDPERSGMMILPVRAEGLEASRGATDFGEYFLYFSFFLVVSALLLTALFFRLGIEQRLPEIGVLQSLGFSAARLRLMFLGEAAVLTVAGSLLGMLGAYAYGKLMMLGLSTWWAGAVGTTTLSLHAAPSSFLFGAVGGILAALVCIVWTLRSVSRRSARSLLSGSTNGDQSSLIQSPRSRQIKLLARIITFLTAGRASIIFGLLGLMLLLAAFLNRVGQVAGFFGGGALLLIALLCAQSWWLRRRRGRSSIGSGGWPSVFHLGIRNATHRPGRSVLCVTLIATASFMIVAVDAFRRGDQESLRARESGSGGYSLLAESQLPVVYDPSTPEGKDALSLVNMGQGSDTLDGVSFARFRVKPGDDTSCLNLYRPRNPRMIAPTDDFLRSGRFTFQDSLAKTADEKEHPWMILRRELADGAIPVIADANSAAYVLHLKVGEDFLLERERGENALRLRLVGTLADSVFQGELLMSENNFRQLFPEQAGYRFFLLDVPTAERERGVAGVLEERLADFGFDVTPTAERLASFHRVENTYLSTFQMLGGLGLVLGTIGLAVVLLHNVLERRRELALLRAVGYHKFHFALMVIAENALLLFCGLVTGTVCALLAIAPVLLERGGRAPLLSLGALLAAVIASGLVASLLATAAALRSPLIPELRAE